MVGWEPFFRFPADFGFPGFAEYRWYVVLGVISGLVAAVLPVVFYGLRDDFRRLPMPVHFKPAIGGLGVGHGPAASFRRRLRMDPGSHGRSSDRFPANYKLNCLSCCNSSSLKSQVVPWGGRGFLNISGSRSWALVKPAFSFFDSFSQFFKGPDSALASVGSSRVNIL